MEQTFRNQTTKLITAFPFKGSGVINDRLRLDVSGLAANTEHILSYNTATSTFSWAAKPKVYVALLSQTDTDAPVATVLENTLGGTVVWTRNDVGDYEATLSAAFTADKTVCFATIGGNSGFFALPQFARDSANVCKLTCLDDSFMNTDIDSPDANISIEIRVYP